MSILVDYNPQNDTFFNQYYKNNDSIGVMHINGHKAYEVTCPASAVSKMKFSDNQNHYFSVNTIRKNKKRCSNNIVGYNWCFADLDMFHDTSKYYDVTVEEAFCQVKMLFGDTIPEPTVATFTGRGFCLLWKLKKNNDASINTCESFNAKKRWRRINKQLNERLAECNADMGICQDSARLLRVPGTMNLAAKTRSNIIFSHPDCAYTLSEIDNFLKNTKYATDSQYELLDKMQETLDNDENIYSRRDVQKYIKNNYVKYRHKKYGFASEKQIKFCTDLAKRNDISLPKNTKYYHEADKFIKKYYCDEQDANDKTKLPNKPTKKFIKKENPSDDMYYNMYIRRLSMIEDSINEDPDRTGSRENILFVYRYYANVVYGAKKATEMTLNLNHKFAFPLSDREVTRATRSAEKYVLRGEEYKLSIPMFCQKTGITEKYYRNYRAKNNSSCSNNTRKTKTEINRDYYKKQLLINKKMEKKESIRIRQILVNDFIRAGYSIEKIAKFVNVGTSTVRRDIEAIKRNQSKKKSKNYINKNILSVRNKIVESIEKAHKLNTLAPFARAFSLVSKNSDRIVLYVRSTLQRSWHKLSNAPTLALALLPSG